MVGSSDRTKCVGTCWLCVVYCLQDVIKSSIMARYCRLIIIKIIYSCLLIIFYYISKTGSLWTGMPLCRCHGFSDTGEFLPLSPTTLTWHFRHSHRVSCVSKASLRGNGSVRIRYITFLLHLYVKSPAHIQHPIPSNQWSASQNPVPRVGDDPTIHLAASFTFPSPSKTTKKTTDPPSSSAAGFPRCAIYCDPVQ